MSSYQSFFHVVFILLSRLFMPRYDTRLQLLTYQVQMLRNRIADSKIIPTETERTELIRLGALLENDITDVMLVVQPATYRRWLRKKKRIRRKPGRPGTPQATVNLVLQFASENLAWGYRHLHGELKKLGIRIGLTTIRDILKRAGHHPVPDKGHGFPKSNWKQFISSHMDTLIATDFFTKPIYTWKGRIDATVMVFIHLGSRSVFMSPATFNPKSDWILQQSRNASMWLQDLGIEASHLIHDRDFKYSARFDRFWQGAGTKILKTPVQAPKANAFIECYIGKCKRECLNHFICVTLKQLDHINREWLAYYHNERPHQGVDIGNKVLRPNFKPTDKGEIKRGERLGGIISWYYREAA
ncbi:MAG: transposase [Kiritimatiellales bacterium]|nr:transposase [Kiritimatiellales bacterium]